MFDSHCHLDFSELRGDLAAHLESARALGVRGWLAPGCAPAQWSNLDELLGVEGVAVAYGIHPWWAADVADLPGALSELSERLERPEVSAVGECGLDALVEERVPRDLQVKVFEAQLELARERELPLVLHQVRSREAFLLALGRVGLSAAGGVVHGFSGDAGWAAALLRRGLHLGFGPALLRPGRDKLRAALATVPLERLLLETDAPDQGLGGQRGRPADLAAVVEAAARCLGRDAEELGERTAENAWRLLGIGGGRAQRGAAV